jgi:hypothetical protein
VFKVYKCGVESDVAEKIAHLRVVRPVGNDANSAFFDGFF